MSSPLIQPPTQTRSLWDTLTMHASNLYTKSKALANTATDRIRGQTPSVGTPSVGTPSVGTPSVGTPSVGTPSVVTPRQQMAITSGGKKTRRTQKAKKGKKVKVGKSVKKAKKTKGGKKTKTKWV
jgi:hypothetical protein